MQKILLISVLLGFSAVVSATNPVNVNDNENINVTTSYNHAENKQFQSAEALAKSKASSSSVATGGNANTVSSANGGTSSVSGFNGGSQKVVFNSSQVRQTPFAFSPGLVASFSQDNCANSASLGASAGFAAIGGGAPVESDACNRRKDVALWLATGQNRIACERMVQDEENLEAMKKAGLDCAKLTAVPTVVESSYVPPRFIDPDQDYKLNSIFSKKMRK